MKTPRRYRYAGPALLALSAIAIASLPLLAPNSQLDFGPIDLRKGAARTVEFKAPYTEIYAIGIAMDQRAAKRLYPCMVDTDAALYRCPHDTAAEWPARLSLSLSSPTSRRPPPIEISEATAGGEYGGEETYTWQPAYVQLKRGVTYRLAVRSLTDASVLSPAKPRLVVEVTTAGFGDEQALKALASFAAAALLLVVAVAWLIIGWVMSRRARARPGPLGEGAA